MLFSISTIEPLVLETSDLYMRKLNCILGLTHLS